VKIGLDEKYTKGYRIAGALQALDTMAKSCECQPCDRTTAALLDAIKALTHKAVVSAWEYADLACTDLKESKS
jgi:hypothetical protein